MCNKVSYNNKKEAETKLNFLKKSRNIKIKPIRFYFCEVCKGYHLTHQNKNIYD